MEKHNFEFWYKLLLEYYNENGNIDISNDYITKEGYKLGKWLSNKRQAYKGLGTNRITDYEIKKLNELNNTWNVRNTNWEKYYLSAKKYYEKNGNLLVHIDYVDDNNIKLGKWINTMREAYRGNDKLILTNEQIIRLEKIKMIWKPNNYKLMTDIITNYNKYGKTKTLLRRLKKYLETIDNKEFTNYNDIKKIENGFMDEIDYCKK